MGMGWGACDPTYQGKTPNETRGGTLPVEVRSCGLPASCVVCGGSTFIP